MKTIELDKLKKAELKQMVDLLDFVKKGGELKITHGDDLYSYISSISSLKYLLSSFEKIPLLIGYGIYYNQDLNKLLDYYKSYD